MAQFFDILYGGDIREHTITKKDNENLIINGVSYSVKDAKARGIYVEPDDNFYYQDEKGEESIIGKMKNGIKKMFKRENGKDFRNIKTQQNRFKDYKPITY